ncbi:MAG: DEAD/DEAH box helicase family protein [Rikenellaceae bacterium]
MKNLQDIIREEFGKRTIERTELPDYFATSLNPAFKLRPYQEECFKYFLNYWENPFEGKEYLPQLMFHMATGSGKTLIMAGVMLYLYEKGYRNFLFFVNSSNIIEKTKENFLNQASHKYLFAPVIEIGGKRVEVNLVDNFQGVADDCINLCLTTIQGLHSTLNNPKENAITYDDFADQTIVLISDEAHHINTATKKGQRKADAVQLSAFDDVSDDWETTVMRIFKANGSSEMPNVLLEFTATADLTDANIAEKYSNKVIFDYPLKRFREDGYSKDIEVVQSDLTPIERAIQTVVLNQYKRKLFASIGQDIKPVMMLKSKTIADNKSFYAEFVGAIHTLNAETLLKIKDNAKDDILSAFVYFDELGVTLENLLLEIKEDFKEDNLLLVDGNNITPEKQLQLNTLEAKDNEFRVVFAVDMLNEGWDVLNLYDIVRLYETRDASGNKPGKTTMQEAQLIGRGARYMPFTAPEGDKPTGERKYDKDIENRLRAVEKLHYHSGHNPRYISELKTAMEQTGIIAKRTVDITVRLKDSFKKTELYTDGYVLGNKRDSYAILENIEDIGKDILDTIFKVRLRSGEVQTSVIYGTDAAKKLDNDSLKIKTITLKELGRNVLRAAINRLGAYSFAKLSEVMPMLKSIEEFITSPKYLADIRVSVSGREEILNELSQKQKLSIAMDVLKQMEPMFGKSVTGYRGNKKFEAIGVFKDTFKDKTMKITLDDNPDKEFGKSMKESGMFSSTDLSVQDWYAFDDCYGTSEEKYFVKYFESLVPQLKEKYEDVYLVRNEREVALFEFAGGANGGRRFEPDFLLFMKLKSEKGYENYQIFIEPKGSHLKEHDAWKQDFLSQINEQAVITFSTQGGSTYSVFGMPFYIEESKGIFDRAFKNQFGVGAW